MSLAKVSRKIKRVGKNAVQFRITSTFEFIELECKGSWRPDKLRVIWLRSHRKVKSNDTAWVVSEDFGPNGARGKAVFNPSISVALVVTLYRDANHTEFDEKEYKYHIENEGPGGKKILATFNCNIAEFVAIPSARYGLDLNFKCVSKKIKVAKLGITLESQFIKEGGANDDDMQSTFSAVSAGQDSITPEDDEEDDEEDEELPVVQSPLSLHGSRGRLDTLKEDSEPPQDVPASPDFLSVDDPMRSLELGTGERIKKFTLSRNAPPKPPRNLEDLNDSLTSEDRSIASQSLVISNDEWKQGAGEEVSASGEKQGSNPNVGEKKEGVDENGLEAKYEVNGVRKIDEAIRNAESAVQDVAPSLQDAVPAVENANSAVKNAPNVDSVISVGSGGGNIEETPQAKELEEATTMGGRDAPNNDQIASGKETDKVVTSCTGVVMNGFMESEKKLEPESNLKDDNGVGSGINSEGGSAGSLAEVTNNGEISHSSTFTGSHRRTVESKEDYVPPPNPYITEEEPPSPEVPKPPSCTEAWLDPGTVLIDCFEEVVGREKVDQAEIIGLYFSAGWCPPCRRFLPKLVKFYHHLKQHGKSFEIIYISSDYSKQDMMKYMKEQQMPWIGISYEGDVAEEFRKKFSISAVPILKILGNRGEVIEETAKKLVDSASNGSAILKLYNKWHEKVEVESSSEDGKSKERKGILSKVKGFHSKDKTKDSEHTMEHQSSVENGSNSSSETGRMVVDTKTRSKSKTKMALTQEAMEEKEERIHHLEEVNRTLKQTNDDLSEEVSDLRQKLEQVTAELDQLKSTSKTLQDESKELIANLNMRGWLYKRGVRGPTASIFRRRYFRLDQGSKLYYYKNSSEGNPQGYIDLDKVLSVQEVTASQQDKNHATFTVQCDGRTFQLQAHDETNMRKWMEAILYMTRWRKKHSSTFSEDP